MEQSLLTVETNRQIAPGVFRMTLSGYNGQAYAGQFIDIKLTGLYLRRPISVSDYENGVLTIIYKTVGQGTKLLSEIEAGEKLDVLLPLGNGYDVSKCDKDALVIGGGVGIPPLYLLCRKLAASGKNISVILGFNTKDEIFLLSEFRKIAGKVIVTTADGSFGTKGFVTDAIPEAGSFDHFFACGPKPMLKAVCESIEASGQISLEERMGCGFGTCMCCSCETKSGSKRICRDGPVLFKEEVIW